MNRNTSVKVKHRGIFGMARKNVKLEFMNSIIKKKKKKNMFSLSDISSALEFLGTETGMISIFILNYKDILKHSVQK